MRIPQSPPDWPKELAEKGEALSGVIETMMRHDVQRFVRQANEEYVHWHKLRYRVMPGGIDPMVAWASVQMSRATQFQPLPITVQANRKLHYWLPPRQQEWISTIDQQAGGYLGTRYARSIPDDNDRYLYNSLMEEAIASSQLEGA